MSDDGLLLDRIYVEWAARGTALSDATKRAESFTVANADLERLLAERDATIKALTERLKNTAPAPRLAFTVNKAFTANALSVTQRGWYDRLWTAIRSPRVDPNPRIVAATGAPDKVGWAVKDHIIALLNALDATGNGQFLHEVVAIMEVLRARLSTFTVIYDKDKAFVASLYALVAWACHINRDADPVVFGGCADFWLDHLLKAFGGNVPSDDLMHSYAASIETAWYLYLITGDAKYRANAEANRSMFLGGLYALTDGRLFWDHRPMFARTKSDSGIQRVTYGRYTAQSVAMLHKTDLPMLPMEAGAKTVLGVVRTDGIAWTMDGAGDEVLSKLVGANWGLWCAYEPTGELAKRLAAAWTANSVYIAAALLSVKENT